MAEGDYLSITQYSRYTECHLYLARITYGMKILQLEIWLAGNGIPTYYEKWMTEDQHIASQG